MRKTTYTESAHTAAPTESPASGLLTTSGLPNRLMTAFEVAEFVGCHEETVRRAYLRGLLASQRFGVRSRRFGTFPIGVDPNGQVVLLYLATAPWTDDFRTFILGHMALLSVTPAWTLRLVFPQPLKRAIPSYERVIHEELESPLQEQTINDLKHYFFHRRRGTDLNAIPAGLRDLLNRRAQVFAGPRFNHLYRRWLVAEDAAFRPLPPVIQEALASGRARVECVVCPHTYEHLSPLVSQCHARRRSRHKWEEKGDETSHGINPSLNPVP